jgi:hypothetical protein
VKKRPPNLCDAQKELVRLMKLVAIRHRLFDVFRDFCEMAAIALSNAVDRTCYAKREARFDCIRAKYTKEEYVLMLQMLPCVVMALENGMADVMGALYMALELGSSELGQFFTPFSVSSMMAKMIIGDPVPEIERKGFITVLDPAGGAGGMVIAAAQALRDRHINYQAHMHATLIDIEATALHMAYIQLSLLHVPAILIHGNTLSNEQWEYWVTPAHLLGRWDKKLKQAREAEGVPGPETSATVESVPTAVPLAAMRDRVLAARSELDQLELFG